MKSLCSPSSHDDSTENSETPKPIASLQKNLACAANVKENLIFERVTTGITRLYKVGSAPSAEKALSLRRCSTCSITVFEQTGTNCGVKPVA